MIKIIHYDEIKRNAIINKNVYQMRKH